MFSDAAILGVTLFSEFLDSLHALLHVWVASVKLEVLSESIDLVLQLFLSLLWAQLLGVKHLQTFAQQIVFFTQSSQLLPLFVQGQIHFRLDNVLYFVNGLFGIAKLLAELVSILIKMRAFQILHWWPWYKGSFSLRVLLKGQLPRSWCARAPFEAWVFHCSLSQIVIVLCSFSLSSSWESILFEFYIILVWYTYLFNSNFL